MKKSEQMQINQKVEEMQDECFKELSYYNSPFSNQLDYCQAWIKETKNFIVLKSYNTVIACINKSDNTLYDFLRLVYGYTATSAKHISKFRHMYNVVNEYTYRDC